MGYIVTAAVRIVGLGGSMRAESTSRTALQTAIDGAEAAGADTEVLWVRELDLPMYGPEHGVPDAARKLADAVASAHAMIWSSPTYQGSVSGAVKNALDWLILLADNEPAYLTNKPIGLVATAGGLQGLQTINAMEFSVRALRGWAVPLVLPMVSLGFWQNFGGDRPLEVQRRIVRRAFDLGITHFDVANNYGPPYGAAEENLGALLAQDFGRYRDELVISTKAGWDMWPSPYGDRGSRKYLRASPDQSLRRPGLEYVDIAHAPRAMTRFPATCSRNKCFAPCAHSTRSRRAVVSRWPRCRCRGPCVTRASRRSLSVRVPCSNSRTTSRPSEGPSSRPTNSAPLTRSFLTTRTWTCGALRIPGCAGLGALQHAEPFTSRTVLVGYATNVRADIRVCSVSFGIDR